MNGRSSLGIRLILAFVVLLGSLFTYLRSGQKNEVTGQTQRVSLNKDEEKSLGLHSTPQMLQQYGGEVSDTEESQRVDRVGRRVVERSSASKGGYTYNFHLLNDDKTVNAFALPGGQVFMTHALLKRLKTESAIAGVLGHEIGHVIARHGAQHLAKDQLTQGVIQAVGVGSDSQSAAQMAAAVGNMVSLKYGRNDELEADALGVRFMSEAGYDPRGMLEVMQTLAALSNGSRQPEFFSTHPNPENRIPKIKAAIQNQFPQGIPAGLDH